MEEVDPKFRQEKCYLSIFRQFRDYLPSLFLCLSLPISISLFLFLTYMLEDLRARK